MNNIQKILNVLIRIKPTMREITKVKVLIGCHGKWIAKRELRLKTGLSEWKEMRLIDLVENGMLDAQSIKIRSKCGSFARVMHYKTSSKGIEYLTELMR